MHALLRSASIARGIFLFAVLALVALPAARAQTRYAAGDVVQEFTLLERGTGRPVSLSSLAGKIVFLEWFAWWCPFCQAAAAQLRPGIDDHYAGRGNAHGVPVVHVLLNLQSAQEQQTQNFLNAYGLSSLPVLDDFSRALANRFQPGGQPIFAIINGVAGSPGLKQWELLHTQLGYGQTQFPIAEFRGVIDAVRPAAPVAPAIVTQPASRAAEAGSPVSLTVEVTGAAEAEIQWSKNGTDLAGATGGSLTIADVQPAGTGLYRATATTAGGVVASTAAIVGVSSARKVTGAGAEVGANIFVAANGNTFDQVLLSGSAATITADAGQITRVSFLDLSDDIVQVEFSGAGTLSLVLDAATGPSAPVNYSQAVAYMKGHAGIVISGADETTNVGIFSVGRITAVNQALFKSGVSYDGLADVAFVAIASVNGKFGGLRAANTSFFATKGFTGVYAPGVAFTGPVFVGDIGAFGEATPVLQLGAAGDARITGGDLAQTNGRAVQVSGLTQLKFAPGTDSHGTALPAKTNQGRLEQDGIDVTAAITVNPGP